MVFHKQKKGFMLAQLIDLFAYPLRTAQANVARIQKATRLARQCFIFARATNCVSQHRAIGNTTIAVATLAQAAIATFIVVAIIGSTFKITRTANTILS